MGFAWLMGMQKQLERIRHVLAISPWPPIIGRILASAALLTGLAYLGGRASLDLVHAHNMGAEPAAAAIGHLQFAPSASHHAVTAPSQLAAPPASNEQQRGDPACSGDGRAITDDGRVVLNLATARDLERLPGVGPKRAQAIIKLRNRLGRFRSVRDLLRVRGFGIRTIRKLAPHLVVDPPKTAEQQPS